MILKIIYTDDDAGDNLCVSLNGSPNGTCTSSKKSINIRITKIRIRNGNKIRTNLFYLNKEIIDECYGGKSGCIFKGDGVKYCGLIDELEDLDVFDIYKDDDYVQILDDTFDKYVNV
jgi:hypothetical protein